MTPQEFNNEQKQFEFAKLSIASFMFAVLLLFAIFLATIPVQNNFIYITLYLFCLFLPILGIVFAIIGFVRNEMDKKKLTLGLILNSTLLIIYFLMYSFGGISYVELDF